MLVCLACSKQTHLPSPLHDDNCAHSDHKDDPSSLGCKIHSPTKQHIKSFTNQVKELVMKWAYRNCKGGPCVFRCRAEQGMPEMQQIQILMAGPQGSDQLRRISDQINKLLRLDELERRIKNRCSSSSVSDGDHHGGDLHNAIASPATEKEEIMLYHHSIRHSHELLRNDSLLPAPALLHRSKTGKQKKKKQQKKKRKKMKRNQPEQEQKIKVNKEGNGDGALFLQRLDPLESEAYHGCISNLDSAAIESGFPTGDQPAAGEELTGNPNPIPGSPSSGPLLGFRQNQPIQDHQSQLGSYSSTQLLGSRPNEPESVENYRPVQHSVQHNISEVAFPSAAQAQLGESDGRFNVEDEASESEQFPLGLKQNGRCGAEDATACRHSQELKSSDSKPNSRNPDSGEEQRNCGVEELGLQGNGGRDGYEEWVAQVEPGVIITFVARPDGCNTLKRIRFSQEMFSKWQAQQWWVENSEMVHELYSVRSREGDTSCTSSSSKSSFSSSVDRPLQNTPEEGSPLHSKNVNMLNISTMMQSKLMQLSNSKFAAMNIHASKMIYGSFPTDQLLLQQTKHCDRIHEDMGDVSEMDDPH